MMPIPLATQSYQHRSLPLSAQRLVNLFSEAAPPDARAPVPLVSSPGLVSFAEVGSGPIQALHEMAGILYAVSGDYLYRINAAGTGTQIGVLAGRRRTGARIDVADNGLQLVAVNTETGQGTVYTAATGTLSRITDPDWAGARSVAYVDGYFVFAARNSGQWFISEILTGASYDALDFASAEAYPDLLIRAFVDHREVWLFGQKSIEVWTNTGNDDFPFTRLGGAVLERGLAATGSVARLDNSVYWLGDDLQVYRAAGYAPQRISHHAIEQAISGYSTVADATAFSYSQDGHSFYVLTFPSAPATFVYDAATGRWHERESFTATESHGRWRANSYARCYEKHLVGDYQTGRIYQLDPDTYTENGEVLRRELTSAPIASDGNRLVMSRLEVDMETGIGTATGDGLATELMVQFSDDGGRSWSNERWTSLGAVGAFRTRARFHRLGQFRERVLRLAVSDPVPVTVYSARADLEAGLP